MSRHRISRRGGFTLVEVSIAVGLMGFVALGVHSLLGSARNSYRFSSAATTLEERGSHLVDRIVAQLRSADPDTVHPRVGQPLSRPEIHYQKTGIDALGTVVLGDPMRIRLDPGTDRLVLTERPGGTNEREIVWGRSVARLMAGEEANGVDDNGNGLVDEPGFCVSFDGDICIVQMTLEAEGPGEQNIQRTFEGRVVYRVATEGGAE